jgi:hypothetical protein
MKYRRTDCDSLNETLDAVYRRVEHLNWSDAELARQAGLCVQTVHRLSHRITRYPRYATVDAMVRAVGGRLSITIQALKIRRAR